MTKIKYSGISNSITSGKAKYCKNTLYDVEDKVAEYLLKTFGEAFVVIEERKVEEVEAEAEEVVAKPRPRPRRNVKTMAVIYETPTALSQFNFTQFKAVMGVSDIDEPTYSLLLRSVFDHIKTVHDIDVDTVASLTYDLVFAIYRHTKFMFEVHNKNLDIIEKTSDTSGNKTEYKVETPKDIISTYRMYSPNAPASL